MTSAPFSASSVAVNGPATMVPVSRTRIPDRAPNLGMKAGAGILSVFFKSAMLSSFRLKN